MEKVFRVYQREPVDRPKRMAEWMFFFLVDEEHEDVFVPAPFLKRLDFLALLCAEDALIYTGPIKQIRNKPFASARALSKDDSRFDELRRNILAGYRKCATVVESFDEPW